MLQVTQVAQVQQSDTWQPDSNSSSNNQTPWVQVLQVSQAELAALPGNFVQWEFASWCLGRFQIDLMHQRLADHLSLALVNDARAFQINGVAASL